MDPAEAMALPMQLAGARNARLEEGIAQAWHGLICLIPLLPKRKPYQLAAVAILAAGWVWHTASHTYKENLCP